MHDVMARIAENMIGRVTGPMKFRLVLQPLMATFFSVRDGLRDAKAGRPPWFWFLASHREHFAAMIMEAWQSIGKVFILALVLDAIYQFIELHTFYPGEALIVAFLLAILPYIALRGIVDRIAKRVRGRQAGPKA